MARKAAIRGGEALAVVAYVDDQGVRLPRNADFEDGSRRVFLHVAQDFAIDVEKLLLHFGRQLARLSGARIADANLRAPANPIGEPVEERAEIRGCRCSQQRQLVVDLIVGFAGDIAELLELVLVLVVAEHGPVERQLVELQVKVGHLLRQRVVNVPRHPIALGVDGVRLVDCRSLPGTRNLCEQQASDSRQNDAQKDRFGVEIGLQGLRAGARVLQHFSNERDKAEGGQDGPTPTEN